MRVLVIEDDSSIATFLQNGLTEAGFTVDVANDGVQGLHLALVEPYSAAIVDVMLPSMDGLAVIEQLRERKVMVPVLILSAKRTVDDRVRGLQAGGDDYLTKPFSFSEVLARVHALIRRSTGTAEPTSLTAGDVTMDFLAHTARRGDTELDLKPREWSLLEHLMRNRERVVSKTSILEHVYGYGFDPQTNVVDVLIHRLRSRVDKEFEKKHIETVRGVGYVFRP